MLTNLEIQYLFNCRIECQETKPMNPSLQRTANGMKNAIERCIVLRSHHNQQIKTTNMFTVIYYSIKFISISSFEIKMISSNPVDFWGTILFIIKVTFELFYTRIFSFQSQIYLCTLNHIISGKKCKCI